MTVWGVVGMTTGGGRQTVGDGFGMTPVGVEAGMIMWGFDIRRDVYTRSCNNLMKKVHLLSLKEWIKICLFYTLKNVGLASIIGVKIKRYFC
jgi:hypothetical protein